MAETYDPQLKARLTLDEAGRVRGINQVDEFWEAGAKSARQAALAYLRTVAATLDVPSDQFAHAHQPVTFLDPAERGTEFRLSEEKSYFDATTEGFYQTHLNVPVWGAGVTVTVKHNPMRVVGAVNTSLADLDVELPSDEVIQRWRDVFERAAGEKAQAGFAEGESELAPFVADVLGGRAFRRSTAKTAEADRERARSARILSGRFFVHRYDPAARLAGPAQRPAAGPDEEGFAEEWPEVEPTLPLPPVDRRIRPGGDYLVAEIVFFYPTPEWGEINWRALVEVETGSILYLRALAAAVNGLVFVLDPISESGNAANGPNQTSAVLNPFRDDVVLPNLNAPVAGTQSLAGLYATVAEEETPTIAAPTQPSGNDFDYDARSNQFAAVNAYYHTNRFFELVEDLGFTLATYFAGTTFPVPVDHRGLGTAINAHCVGTGSGIDHLCYALAHTGDTTNPIGIAADWRVHLHELGGHGILHDHVGGPNFGFSHSAGDSMAVILTDPDSQAPDRFLLAPFVPAVVRRHDRPVATWAWGGPNDVGGYSSEQILSTTLFRVYRSIGGDSTSLARRRFASRYLAYLILRTVGTLTPATNPATAAAFANQLMAVDLLNWTSEGIDGGAYGKVIRWAFEQQGMYQPGAPAPGSVTAPGAPPAVDVYIDDGRGGEYPYQAVHWNTAAIWNRTSADAGTAHQSPVLGATNYVYVKVKNRGTQTATNVVVKGYHTKPGAGLLWPVDFEPLSTAQLSVGTLAPNDGEEKTVGPFEWTPNINGYGHDCLLMVVSATGDPSNVDNFTAGEVIPEWRLVPNDNNVGQRNVNPVPGGGGLAGLIAGLHGIGMWVGNPNPGRAVIELDVRLPDLLAERGWRLGFRGMDKARFALASRERRELVLELDPGAGFERGDVEATEDRDIVVTVAADGAVIGGMTYRLDPALERPVNLSEGRPGAGERCKVHAQRLLECLDLHGHPVGEVRVKKVSVDITMDHPCC
jgi:zinc metalloprotease ZmpB